MCTQKNDIYSNNIDALDNNYLIRPTFVSKQEVADESHDVQVILVVC